MINYDSILDFVDSFKQTWMNELGDKPIKKEVWDAVEMAFTFSITLVTGGPKVDKTFICALTSFYYSVQNYIKDNQLQVLVSNIGFNKSANKIYKMTD